MTGLVAGPPDVPDRRLQRREPIALPAGAVLAFERINRGKNPSPNYRWLLTEDGAVRLARHSGDTSDPDRPFDTPLPEQPTGTLEPHRLAMIRAAIEAADPADQPAYLSDPGVEDGAFSVITLPTGSGSRELVLDGATTPLVQTLRQVAEDWLAGDFSGSGDPGPGDW